MGQIQVAHGPEASSTPARVSDKIVEASARQKSGMHCVSTGVASNSGLLGAGQNFLKFLGLYLDV